MADSCIADEVPGVRSVLRGKRMLLLGGDYRPHHAQRICEAFSLSSLVWVETRESDASARRFRAFIERRDVQIAVSLVGLLRHQHTRDLRLLCNAAAIPLVHAYRSPNPTMLARAIANQVGVRLRIPGVLDMRR